MSEFKLGMANVTFVMRQPKNSYLAMTSAIIEPSDGGKIEVNTAEAFDKGVDAERERIIELLENADCKCISDPDYWDKVSAENNYDDKAFMRVVAEHANCGEDASIAI
jgi:hypothetical protein